MTQILCKLCSADVSISNAIPRNTIRSLGPSNTQIARHFMENRGASSQKTTAWHPRFTQKATTCCSVCRPNMGAADPAPRLWWVSCMSPCWRPTAQDSCRARDGRWFAAYFRESARGHCAPTSAPPCNPLPLIAPDQCNAALRCAGAGGGCPLASPCRWRSHNSEGLHPVSYHWQAAWWAVSSGAERPLARVMHSMPAAVPPHLAAHCAPACAFPCRPFRLPAALQAWHH